MTDKNTMRIVWVAIAVAILVYLVTMPKAAAGWTGNQQPDVHVETPVSVRTGGTVVNGGPTNVTTGPTNVTTGPNTMTTGPNNTSFESRALALSNVLGDVDIAACLGSTQWSTPIYGRQRLVLNQVCMAEFYLETGKYQLAAMALCNVPEILAEFDTETACEASHDFTGLATPSPPPMAAESSDEDDEYHAQIVEQKKEITVLNKRLVSLEKKKAPSGLTSQQRAELAEVFKQ